MRYCCLIVTLSVGLASAQTTEWEKLSAAGLEAYREGRYAEAEGLLSSALETIQGLNSDTELLAKVLKNLAGVYTDWACPLG